jgi:ferredoxin
MNRRWEICMVEIRHDIMGFTLKKNMLYPSLAWGLHCHELYQPALCINCSQCRKVCRAEAHNVARSAGQKLGMMGLAAMPFALSLHTCSINRGSASFALFIAFGDHSRSATAAAFVQVRASNVCRLTPSDHPQLCPPIRYLSERINK